MLITLGIIGVVAAMTIPNLVTKYHKRAVAVQVKQAYAEILQALKLSEADYGDITGWTVSGNINSTAGTGEILSKYFIPYFTGITECQPGLAETKCGAPISEHGHNYLLHNGVGMSVVIWNDTDHAINGVPGLYIRLTVNPRSGGKNIMGKNVFWFDTVNTQGTLRPHGWRQGLTREMLFNGNIRDLLGRPLACMEKATKDIERYRHGCTALFVLDGFEFRNDYPW